MKMGAIHYLATESARDTLWIMISATLHTANKCYPITGLLKSLPNSQLAVDPLRLAFLDFCIFVPYVRKANLEQ